MTLQEACKQALTILKQVMEEKLSATNVEVFEAIAALYHPINFKTLEGKWMNWSQRLKLKNYPSYYFIGKEISNQPL